MESRLVVDDNNFHHRDIAITITITIQLNLNCFKTKSWVINQNNRLDRWDNDHRLAQSNP